MKRTLIRILFLILLAFMFYIIFKFSSQNGVESKGVSEKFTTKIINILPFTKNLNQNTKIKIIKNAVPIMRKLAHLSLYTLVGIFIMSFISTYNIILLKKFIISLMVGLIYAISDEIHQSFLPGRTASIRDVCIDTAGVFLGIIIVLIIISVFKALAEGVKRKEAKHST